MSDQHHAIVAPRIHANTPVFIPVSDCLGEEILMPVQACISQLPGLDFVLTDADMRSAVGIAIAAETANPNGSSFNEAPQQFTLAHTPDTFALHRHAPLYRVHRDSPGSR
jgi:hypothetical protein